MYEILKAIYCEEVTPYAIFSDKRRHTTPIRKNSPQPALYEEGKILYEKWCDSRLSECRYLHTVYNPGNTGNIVYDCVWLWHGHQVRSFLNLTLNDKTIEQKVNFNFLTIEFFFLKSGQVILFQRFKWESSWTEPPAKTSTWYTNSNSLLKKVKNNICFPLPRSHLWICVDYHSRP